MTLKKLTGARYARYADVYINRAYDFRVSAQENGQWWKPKIKKHWLFLLKMARFYINNSKYNLGE